MAAPLTGKRSPQRSLPAVRALAVGDKSAPTSPIPALVEGFFQAVRDVERKIFGVSAISDPTIGGKPVSQVLTADGTRAVVTTGTSASTQVTVIATATGKQVGATLTIPGSAGYGFATALSADGSRAVVTTAGPSPSTIQVAVIDTATGKQVGDTLTFTGDNYSSVLNKDGSRVVLTAGDYDTATYYNSATQSGGDQYGDGQTSRRLAYVRRRWRRDHECRWLGRRGDHWQI